MVKFDNEWDTLLKGEFEKTYYQELRQKLAMEYKTKTVYPDKHDIFNALKYTSYSAVKVVILGQDPYHGPGQAHGLSFSVQEGVDKPPSLVNIFKEIQQEFGFDIPSDGCLIPWAKQGVLLLNATLTVRAGQANSHQALGWECFTDSVIKLLDAREKPMVFMLWGNNAKKKLTCLQNPKHKLLKATHPSPLSANSGFFGCGHFVQANEFLVANGESAINWVL